MSKYKIPSIQQVVNEMTITILNGSTKSEAIQEIRDRLQRINVPEIVISEIVDSASIEVMKVLQNIAKNYAHAASGIELFFDSPDKGHKVARKVDVFHLFGSDGVKEEYESLRIVKF